MGGANTEEFQSKTENPSEPTNIFSMLPKVELKFPFFNQQLVQNPDDSVQKQDGTEIPKPPSLFVGNRRNIPPPPLEFEAEESFGRTSNPIVLWQVYAIGGFFVLKWVWARWNERKKMGSDKEPSDDDEQLPAVDDSQYV